MQGKVQRIDAFHRLVGKWKLSGDVDGSVEYRLAEGGHFLIQEVALTYAGRAIRGVEYIGNVAKPGGVISPEVRSRFYSLTDGLTLDYIYEMDADTLRIWFEDKALNNFMQAEFSHDGQQYAGAWQWPGGGYRFKAERL